MPLNKDVLGQLLFDRRQSFCDKDLDELKALHGNDMNAIRLAAAKADAEVIINHFKTAGVVNVNVTVTTTGTATNHTGTGTGVGTIS